MGFEQVVPPIPDRQAELDGLSRLQTSWKNQPYIKYYMNESLRQPKLRFSAIINKAYSSYFFNTLVATVILIPFSVIARRFFVKRGGLPMTMQPDYFNRTRTDEHVRRWSYYKFVLPAHILGSVFLGIIWTDYSDMLDPNYEFVHKTTKMM